MKSKSLTSVVRILGNNTASASFYFCAVPEPYTNIKRLCNYVSRDDVIYFNRAQRETCHRMREWSDVPPDRWVVDSRTPFSQNTGVEATILSSLGEALLQPPANIDLHLQVKHLIASRLEKLGQGLFDWATAEALAVATLLRQGVHVRFTGQDIQTGMFSGRHWVSNIVKRFL